MYLHKMVREAAKGYEYRVHVFKDDDGVGHSRTYGGWAKSRMSAKQLADNKAAEIDA